MYVRSCQSQTLSSKMICQVLSFLSIFILNLTMIELADVEMDDVDLGLDAEDVDEKLITGRTLNGTTKMSDIDRNSTHTLLLTLTQPLIKLVHPTTLSFPPNPSEPSPHPPTTSALSTIHVRALECLNNLFLAVEEAEGDGSAISPDDRESVKLLWTELWHALSAVGKVVKDGKVVASRGLEKKAEMWQMAVGVLWGMARVGRGHLVGVISFYSGYNLTNMIQVPDAEQVQALMEFCDAAVDDMTKVKCIGSLECLAQNVEAVDANKVIYDLDDLRRESDLFPDYIHVPSYLRVFLITHVSRNVFAIRFSAHRHLFR